MAVGALRRNAAREKKSLRIGKWVAGADVYSIFRKIDKFYL
jgi:hypothetical protein